jgi:molybdopterin molybdotransferase
MPADAISSNILSFEDARRLVERHASQIKPSATESVPLLQSLGRVLAEEIRADRDFPPFPRATRDGYAVLASDLKTTPASLEIIGEIKAGDAIPRVQNVRSGQAVSIMTGAPVPAGADAVVMVEFAATNGQTVTINRSVAARENIVAMGSEARRGDILLFAGHRLGYAEIGAAAATGRDPVIVFRKPRIAVLATGDEIVDLHETPGYSQIRNSNSHSLAAQIVVAGGEPVLLPIAPDEPKRLRELIVQGATCDLLLLAGGVSMGRYDLVEDALQDLGAEFLFTGVRIQPGRPAVFGRWNAVVNSEKYFFGLPGNPVSTMVTFELFARPTIEALAGMLPRKLIFLHARLKSPISVKPGLKRFLPAMLSGEFENATAELIPWQGSGDLTAIATANCYIVISPQQENIEAGEWVPLLLR